MDAEVRPKNCPDCGNFMWLADIEGHGRFWQCTRCHQTVDEQRNRFRWSKPSVQVNRGPSANTERKFKSHERCPRCGEALTGVEVPNYGTRMQCENCRISIVDGAILEWKGAPRA
jgi:ribosomal protein S27AE